MAETAYYACDYTNYIAAWKRFLNLKPDIYEAWNSKGTALCKAVNNVEAIDAYNQAITIKPDYYEAWKNKTSALFRLGRSEEAVPSHKQTRKLKPTS